MVFIASALPFRGGGRRVVNIEKLISYTDPPKKLLRVLCVLLKPCSLDHSTTCIIHSLALVFLLSLEFKVSYNKEFQSEAYFYAK